MVDRVREQGTTIAALATAPAAAGIAVVRVSGPDVRSAVRAVFRSPHSPLEEPRKLVLGYVIDFATGKRIDQALAAFMPNPASFTGEDVVEFQFHGSPLIAQRILGSLYAFGISPAEPGEFSRRAFLNGKLDLVQAEAICDLIQASSERALALAREQLQGRLSGIIEQLGEPLRDLLAEIEASIDFPEEDIAPETVAELLARLESTTHTLERLIQSFGYGAAVKEGFRVLLCGPPNAGKSSLLNLLLGKQRAIVTDVAGTTRDLIEEAAVLDGYQFVFCDSAGITDTADTVERIGIELAKERLTWADLVLFVLDANEPSVEWRAVLDEVRKKTPKIWMIVNKIDLNPSAIGELYCDSAHCEQNFYLSAKTGDGYQALIRALVEEVASQARDTSATSEIVTNERHRSCLQRSLERLRHALESLRQDAPLEVVSADLRGGLGALDELIGKTYTEDILGRIFSKFCIGK